MANLQNLKPWPKGVSGNPGGRPSRRAITEALETLVRDQDAARALATVWLKKAMAGDYRFLREVLDRLEGKIPEIHELGSDEDKPVKIVVEYVDRNPRAED